MPDAATLAAARPKCPVGPNRPGSIEADEPCGEPLRYDAKAAMWRCSIHGAVTTPESLVHRQRA